ncbi:MAG: hypothetical protein C0404_05870 [Verrucomicrobia bacterium]|nr:hypothetical protein [Verrucomicrobiota bacterium]
MATSPFGLAASGVLILVKGDVSVVSGGRTAPATSGMKIAAGDVVKAGGGSASILLSDGRMRTVKEKDEFAVPADDPKAAPDKLSSKIMATLRETVSTGRDPTVAAAVRSDSADPIRAVYPLNSAVLAEDLRFEWAGKGAVSELEVFVKSPAPAYRYSFTVKAGEKRVTLPKDAPPLQPGVTYYWKVASTENDAAIATQSSLSSFSLLSKDDAVKLAAELKLMDDGDGKSDPGQVAITRACVYLSYGMNNNAATLLEELVKNTPTDEAAKELLKSIRIKMKDAAAAAAVK